MRSFEKLEEMITHPCNIPEYGSVKSVSCLLEKDSMPVLLNDDIDRILLINNSGKRKHYSQKDKVEKVSLNGERICVAFKIRKVWHERRSRLIISSIPVNYDITCHITSLIKKISSLSILK